MQDTIQRQNKINAETQYQDWGKDKPIPELEKLLTELNRQRARFQDPSTEWDQIRSEFFSKARRLLGAKAVPKTGGSPWNTTINALTLYRADWRGYTIHSSRGGAV